MDNGKKALAIGIGGMIALGLFTSGIESWVSVRNQKKEEVRLQEVAALRKVRVAEAVAAFKAMTPEQHLDETKKSIAASNVGLAKRHLGAIPKGTPETVGLAQQITRLEARAAAQAAKEKAEQEKKAKAELIELAANMVQTRKEFARNLETNYLDKGLNIDVTADGARAETLKLKYALTSKVLAHHITKGDLLESARTLGFKKVWLTNGFSSDLAEGYTWTL